MIQGLPLQTDERVLAWAQEGLTEAPRRNDPCHLLFTSIDSVHDTVQFIEQECCLDGSFEECIIGVPRW